MSAAIIAMDFSDALAALEDECGRERLSYECQERFLQLHLAWAEAAARENPEMSLVQFRAAEDCQRALAGYATSHAEALAATAALYEIMARRASFLEKLASNATSVVARLERLHEARAVLLAVVDNGDGLGEAHRPDLERIEHKMRAFH